MDPTFPPNIRELDVRFATGVRCLRASLEAGDGARGRVRVADPQEHQVLEWSSLMPCHRHELPFQR